MHACVYSSYAFAGSRAFAMPQSYISATFEHASASPSVQPCSYSRTASPMSQRTPVAV